MDHENREVHVFLTKIVDHDCIVIIQILGQKQTVISVYVLIKFLLTGLRHLVLWEIVISEQDLCVVLILNVVHDIVEDDSVSSLKH